MQDVYHGSKVHNLKTLTPHKSTHGEYLYATPDKTIAILMSKCCGSDITYSLHGDGKGHYDLIERMPGALSKMYSTDASIYTLPGDTFKNINTGFNEVVSEESVDVENEEYIPNLYEKLYELEENGLVSVYYYPDRPEYIPEDDSDLLEKLSRYVNVMNKDFSEYEYSKWIFAHPNLEEGIRELAKSKNIELPSYDEIKELLISVQEHDMNHEMFISNSIEMYDLLHSRVR